MSTTHHRQDLDALALRARAAGFMDWYRATRGRFPVAMRQLPHPDHAGAFTDCPDLENRLAVKVLELWIEDLAREKMGPTALLTIEHWPKTQKARVHDGRGILPGVSTKARATMAEALVDLAEALTS